ncbi:uncharacterized protein I303_107609 [Kwoniella dejecticola CBS 10117]|uniref:Uncharacterized protein n=1 Tax=Kwoniella dejecticola CBS 10117 TaxID=1296121 RepID=A0A1A5ZV75_9TREE|nr:uncharacterized protein I303_07620 [Kwoniella dejecticola CBS 10117]OBR81710.1 hypothetical protein I303_07620 [Kwoniella dejecticola CBS 10117]
MDYRNRQVTDKTVTFQSKTRANRRICYSVTDAASNKAYMDFFLEARHTGRGNSTLRLTVDRPQNQTYQAWKHRSEQYGGGTDATTGAEKSIYDAVRAQVQPSDTALEQNIWEDVKEGFDDYWQNSQV